jgi:hypothetical protein
MHTKNFKNKLHIFITAISIFFIIIDTGGWSNLRFLGLLFILISFFYRFNLRNIIKKDIDLFLAILLFLAIFPSLLSPNISNQDFSLGVSQVLPIFLYPLLLILIHLRESQYDEIVSTLTNTFSTVIIVFYILRLLDVSIVNSFAELLDAEREAGFFDYKSNILGVYLPVVYFKPTLLLVPLGLYCLIINKKLAFYCALAALFIAPSRTGFLVLLLFYFAKHFREFSFTSKALMTFFLFLSINFILSFIDLENLMFGLSVRLEHLFSLMKLSINFESIIFGQGPGTSFFSSGFNKMTDGVELSQLEFIRRHGVLGFFCLVLIWVKAAYSNRLWRQPILAYWIVSMSNPVLAVFFSFVLLAVILSKNRGV